MKPDPKALPNCDLVMKGGITSGVVYPLAVAQLAREYRFRNIGGTSAGAIAAAMAAAAEHGRARGGFERLAGVADEIGGCLLDLFAPLPRTRPLFQALLPLLEHKATPRGLAAAALRLVTGYPLHALVGAAPGLVALWWWIRGASGIMGLLAVLLLLLLGLAVALGLRLRRAVLQELPAQGFGLCSGMATGDEGPALTPWLVDKLEIVAGRMEAGGAPPSSPLCFGDLWGEDEADPSVRLFTMTTCLSARRPYRLPFETREFLYKEDEWSQLFPPHIMEWMREHSNELEGFAGYRFLPQPRELPVVVAARMSLSFPLLISAVPLWSRDFNLRDREQAQTPQRLWFSDGGISSNFPIHFFDSIWPQWPTFGITLEPHSAGHHGEDRVHLPGRAGEGQRLDFSRIDGLGAFMGAILGSMQDWQDRLQTTLPGYRERIVHVRLSPDEGGLNLTMDTDKVARLVELGKQAGGLLADEFDFSAHRWRRFVVSMARLEATLEELLETYEQAPPASESLADFLAAYPEQAEQYAQTQAWLRDARADVAELMATANHWAGRGPLRDGRIPKPDTELRITPRS